MWVLLDYIKSRSKGLLNIYMSAFICGISFRWPLTHSYDHWIHKALEITADLLSQSIHKSLLKNESSISRLHTLEVYLANIPLFRYHSQNNLISHETWPENPACNPEIMFVNFKTQMEQDYRM